MSRIGTIFNPHPHPPEELPEAARRAEQAGVGTLWLWEDCFNSSAYAAAAVALTHTERLRVGLGIAPLPLRNAALTAMEIATIARLFPGRFLPGVGHGVQSWMQQAGARVASPLTLLREQVPAVRALLAGETVTTEGRYVTLNDVALDWPPSSVPPVYAAAGGPKTLHLVGSVADGVILDSRNTAEDVARDVEMLRAGRAESGRSDPLDIVAYVVTAFGDDALARAAKRLGDPPDAASRSLSGTPAEVAERAQAYFAVGVDEIALLPTDDADLASFYDLAGEVSRLVAEGSRG
ncbi:LLM class flavin-dependent oxidoreductase [Microbacterium sp. RD1]|uniref:LLM class flavin-dependent oxidoreductase n=1 Tax=Microbacterium sp. RD1 TaxID=3457313 RepID=UPI003FA5661E